MKTINCSLDHRRHGLAVEVDQECDNGAAGAGRVLERLGSEQRIMSVLQNARHLKRNSKEQDVIIRN